VRALDAGPPYEVRRARTRIAERLQRKLDPSPGTRREPIA